MTAQLYCFGESGNSYKAALALTLSGMDWEPVFVDFFNGDTRTAEFRALNEMGEVPVLVDGDATLTQSGVILDYVSSKTGKLGGRSAAERREVLRWLFWDNHKLSTQIGTARFLHKLHPRRETPRRGHPVPAKPAEVGLRGARHASRRTRVDHRRSGDHRRSVMLRVSLLPRTLRLRPVRLAPYRRLAAPHRRAAGLAAPL